MNPDVLYILGAGRSGSTVFAAVLSDHKDIQNTGELHHFFSYLKNNEYCSCGNKFEDCEIWGRVKVMLPEELNKNADTYEVLSNRMEYHSAIPRYLLKKIPAKDFEKYKKAQINILNAIYDGESRYILDSAKYIGRFLALRRICKRKMKGIFLVRDVRGVIWSFRKKVQTQSTPLRTIIYYLLINLVGQIVIWTSPKGQVLKVRYEDLTDQPAETLQRIGKFLEIDFSLTIKKIQNQKPVKIAHLIGGNRLKKNPEITLGKDVEWVEGMSRLQKTVYYLVALPLMIINGYKMLK